MMVSNFSVSVLRPNAQAFSRGATVVFSHLPEWGMEC